MGLYRDFNTSNVTIQQTKWTGLQLRKEHFNTSNVTIQLYRGHPKVK